MDYNFIIGIFFSLGLSIFMLYTRKKKWFSFNAKFVLTATLMTIGIVGFILSTNNNSRFMFYSLIIPFLILLMDRLFKYISSRLHERDFILYLRWSDEIKNRISEIGSNKHVKKSDIIFSFILLLSIMGFTLLGFELFGKDDLYNRWFIY